MLFPLTRDLDDFDEWRGVIEEESQLGLPAAVVSACDDGVAVDLF
jgi:hypothetical protein